MYQFTDRPPGRTTSPSMKMQQGFITEKKTVIHLISLAKRRRSFLRAQRENTFFLNTCTTMKSFQHHLLVLSHSLLCKYIVSNALISFRSISARHCVLQLHLLFSLLIQFEQLYSALGRGGFLYHHFTELKIGSSEHENAFDRGGAAAAAAAAAATAAAGTRSLMFKTRQIRRVLSEVQHNWNRNRLWWIHCSKAIYAWWRCGYLHGLDSFYVMSFC